jgi:hypothetical protein
VARAQEARERCDQAENRLEKETNQRLMAERRLRELEKDRLRQLQAVKVEGAKTLKVMLAHGEMKAKLKKAEGRIKEVENDARSLTLALARADQKRAEAEATARAAEEKAQKIEALFLGEEVAAHEAAERNLVFGFLVYENRRHELLGMERAYRSAEKRRRQQADDLKNFRLKQNAKLSSMSEQSPLAESEFTSFDSPIPLDDHHRRRATGQAELKVNPKFIVYGLAITLILVVVGWALRAAFL